MAHNFYLLGADHSQFVGYTGTLGDYAVPIPTQKIQIEDTPMRLHAETPTGLSFSCRFQVSRFYNTTDFGWKAAFTVLELCQSDGTIVYTLFYTGAKFQWKQRRDGTLFNIGIEFDRLEDTPMVMTVSVEASMSTVSVFLDNVLLSTDTTTTGTVIGGPVSYINFKMIGRKVFYWLDRRSSYFINSILLSEECATQYHVHRECPDELLADGYATRSSGESASADAQRPDVDNICGAYNEDDDDEFPKTLSNTPIVFGEGQVKRFVDNESNILPNYAVQYVGMARNLPNSQLSEIEVKATGSSVHTTTLPFDGDNPTAFKSSIITDDISLLTAENSLVNFDINEIKITFK